MADFAYHRSVAPMIWVLVALGSIELLVVHFLVALWSAKIAALLSIVSLCGLIWLIRAVLSFRHMPVQVGDGRLVMRTGHLRHIDVPLTAIAGLRTDWDAEAIKDRSVLNLALIAYPNIVVDFCEPVASGGLRPRMVWAIAHRFDDPAAFTAAIERLGQAHDRN